MGYMALGRWNWGKESDGVWPLGVRYGARWMGFGSWSVEKDLRRRTISLCPSVEGQG
jgi:hypothetical protein